MPQQGRRQSVHFRAPTILRWSEPLHCCSPHCLETPNGLVPSPQIFQLHVVKSGLRLTTDLIRNTHPRFWKFLELTQQRPLFSVLAGGFFSGRTLPAPSQARDTNCKIIHSVTGQVPSGPHCLTGPVGKSPCAVMPSLRPQEQKRSNSDPRLGLPIPLFMRQRNRQD